MKEARDISSDGDTFISKLLIRGPLNCSTLSIGSEEHVSEKSYIM